MNGFYICLSHFSEVCDRNTSLALALNLYSLFKPDYIEFSRWKCYT
jgi:hypothetical protein